MQEFFIQKRCLHHALSVCTFLHRCMHCVFSVCIFSAMKPVVLSRFSKGCLTPESLKTIRLKGAYGPCSVLRR